MGRAPKPHSAAPRPRPVANKGPPAPLELKPFEAVWDVVRRIPRGRVATYQQISELIGRRLTPVGVGWAVRAAGAGSIPWHRVINARGGLSTEKASPGVQRAMLEAEGLTFDGDGRVDLDRHRWRPRRR